VDNLSKAKATARKLGKPNDRHLIKRILNRLDEDEMEIEDDEDEENMVVSVIFPEGTPEGVVEKWLEQHSMESVSEVKVTRKGRVIVEATSVYKDELDELDEELDVIRPKRNGRAKPQLDRLEEARRQILSHMPGQSGVGESAVERPPTLDAALSRVQSGKSTLSSNDIKMPVSVDEGALDNKRNNVLAALGISDG